MRVGDVPHDFEFSLQFVLGRIRNQRFRAIWRALGEPEQHLIAKAIREYLELANWRYHRGPPAKPNSKQSKTPSRRATAILAPRSRRC